jgi:hypothetical protein
VKKQEELIEFVPPSDTPKPDPNSLVLDATEEPKPTLRVVPKPYLEFGYDDEAFDWADDGSIVIPHAPGVAVYQNANGGIVIRQHASQGDKDDQFVVVRKADARKLAKAITDEAGR